MTSDICVCFTATPPADFAEAVDSFYGLVAACPALGITVPPSLAAEHRQFTLASLDDANHVSVPFLAYRHNRLAEFTGPIHALISGVEGVGQKIVKQYQKDLQEKWILQKSSTARFQKARVFQGRLAELDFANWLTSSGWRLKQLEAYDGDYDIEATAPDGVECTFEVKFLAQREIVFELNRAAFNQSAAARLGVYSPADYLTFRLYQAAEQLKNVIARRIAVAIVRDYNLSYKRPLSENWIDWNKAEFLRKDPEIEAFLEDALQKNPNLAVDVRNAIGSLDEIWIMRYAASGLERVHHYRLRGRSS